MRAVADLVRVARLHRRRGERRLDARRRGRGRRVGAIGDLSTLRWPRALDHGEPGLAGGLAARGRHRLPLPSAPVSGACRAAGAVPDRCVDDRRTRVTTAAEPDARGKPQARRPGLLTALVARFVARSIPAGRRCQTHGPGRAAAEGACQPLRRDAWMNQCQTRRRPWTEFRPIKEMLTRPARAGPRSPRVPAGGQSGGRQDDLKLLEGAETPILGGAGRRGSPGHHDVDHGAQAPPVYMAKVEIEINAARARPVADDAGRHRGRPPRPVEPGQLRGQPRNQAREPRARRSGRQRSDSIAPKVSQYADPAFELISRRSSSSRSRRDQHVLRLPGRQRPGLDQKAAGNLLSEFKKQTDRRKRRQARSDQRVRRGKPEKIDGGPQRARCTDLASAITSPARSARAAGASSKNNMSISAHDCRKSNCAWAKFISKC